MKNELVPWLSTQLKGRAWSQRELARRAGLSGTAVSTVLSRQRNPGWDFCLAIAEPLGEPPILLRKALSDAGLPQEAFIVMKIGGTVVLD